MSRIANSSRVASLIATGLPLLLMACGHEPRPAAAPMSAAPPSAPVASARPARQATIEVSESVRQKCDLPETPREAPQFDFDESALRPRGEGILDDVANCLTTGPMRDESVVLTGRADPRGADDYNFNLGMQRAQAAAEYLKAKGVPSGRIDLRSRGEADANGTDEDTWQLDRRVSIDEARTGQR